MRIKRCIFFSTLVLFGFQNQEKEFFSIDFKLINTDIKLNENNENGNQFCAKIKFTNINHPCIMIPSYFEFGFKNSVEAFYIEAFDLNGEEVDITTSADYDYWHISQELNTFLEGSVLIDTICSDGIYKFNKRGEYKLRFVFDPQKHFWHKGDILGGKIYSNWDTIRIN